MFGLYGLFQWANSVNAALIAIGLFNNWWEHLERLSYNGIIMSDVSIKISVDDAQLLLNLVNQVNAKGKESMIQVLRIIESLELVIPDELEETE